MSRHTMPVVRDVMAMGNHRSSVAGDRAIDICSILHSQHRCIARAVTVLDCIQQTLSANSSLSPARVVYLYNTHPTSIVSRPAIDFPWIGHPHRSSPVACLLPVVRRATVTST